MLNELQLGGLQHKVMEFLWEHGSATADSIRAALANEYPLTDSTVRTVLRRLEAKKYVQHSLEGRRYVFAVVHQPRKLAAESVREIIEKLCHGSLEELLASIVDYRVVESSELRRLAEKIASEERETREV